MISQLLKSRTLVLNVATLVVGTATYLQGQELIAENPDIVAVLATVIAAGNVLLRFLTSVSVLDKSSLLSNK